MSGIDRKVTVSNASASAPNSAPGALAAAGETVIPARSASCAISVAPGAARSSRISIGPSTSVPVIDSSSGSRRLSSSVRERSMSAATAAASKGVPWWKVTPSRSRIVIGCPSSATVQPVASWGTIPGSGVMSTSLSHRLL